MPSLAHGIRVAGFAAVLTLSGLAQADGNPEGVTQRQFKDLTEIEYSGSAPAAAPVEVHNLNDAEKAEMDRMHAVRVIRGRDWKRLTPAERYERIKNLRDTMDGVSLMLCVPSGDLWAIPPGEGGINFQDIVKQKLVRFWTQEEREAMPVAVNSGSGNNLNSGRRDSPLVTRVEREHPP